jgi:glycosyltransferase involved in cell wall biosynthesis
MVEDLKQRGFERVSLWPPAVDSEAFSPSKASAEMRCRLSGNHPEYPLILSVSRLAPEKNVGLLADIMDRVPNARLAIVGDGPDREKLERQFSRLPVTFPGYMSGAELASAYASSDVFLYASETETMGNVILEAMASGLPVVAAAAGGVRSLVEPGSTGFLFPPGCAKDAAAYVRQFVEHTDLRKRMAANSLKVASSQTWSDAASVVRQHYDLTIREQAESQRNRTVSLTASVCTKVLVRAFSVASKFKGRSRRTDFQQTTSAVSTTAGELVQMPGT